MARQLLADTGPLVALIARDDGAHEQVNAFFKAAPVKLLTTWPVLTETWHLLPASGRIGLMQWVRKGGVQVHEFDDGADGVLLALLEKYRDLPMDLADASLVPLAIKSGIHEVLTLDRRDFSTYRLPGNKRFQLVLDQ